jgi:hypothetical protein
MHSATFPICDELAAIRAEMAQWVADKCTKDGKNLRSLVSLLRSFQLPAPPPPFADLNPPSSMQLKKLEMNALSK